METLYTVGMVAAIAAASFQISLSAARFGLRLLLHAMNVGSGKA